MDYNLDGGIDLHIHSIASDGSLTPNEIIDLAHQLRLGAFSITDHDTVAGVKQINVAELPQNLKFIPGIEISCTAPESSNINGSIHLLGYGIDPNHVGLNELLGHLHQARKTRTPRMIQRLNQHGIPLNLNDIEIHNQGGTMGRPHIAMALVSGGYAVSIDDAFERFLGRGKIAYVDKYRVPCHEAIKIIDDAGGVAVLAHPFLIEPRLGVIKELVELLIPMGLSGIECIYPQHPPDAVSSYQMLANRNGLLITGGTDFHGPEITPGIKLGSANGDFHVPFEFYLQLQAKLTEIKLAGSPNKPVSRSTR